MPIYQTFNQVSQDNSTSSPLTTSGTFTGTWEQSTQPDVLVSCKTDQPGILYFDFSPDGVNADSTFPPSGFPVASGINEFHRALKGGRYFRTRLVNESDAQSFLRLKTSYGIYNQPSAPLNQSISLDSDSILVKAVGVGREPNGSYSNVPRTGNARLHESPLASGAVWDSGIISTDGYEFVTLALYADQPFERQLIFYESDQTTQVDGSTRTVPLNIKGNTLARELLSLAPRSEFFRVIITNTSNSDMTLSNFDVRLNAQSVGNSQLPLDIPLRDGATAGLTRAIIVGRQPDGDYVNAPQDGSAFTTSETLSGGATYTSSWVDSDGWNSIELTIVSDVESDVDGIEIEFTDNTQADTPVERLNKTFTFTERDINRGFLIINFKPILDGFRIKYTNGSAAQSLFFLDATLKINSENSLYNDGGALVVANFEDSIGIGDVPNYLSISKFGYNPDVDTGPEDVWYNGGDYTGHPTTSAQAIRVTSSSTSDSSSGTGMRTIRIFGLKSSISEKEEFEDITLNGTNDVVSVNSWYRIYRAYGLTYGTGETNDGTITIRHNVTTANIFGTIPPGFGQTQICAYTIPNNATGYMNGIYVTMVRANGSAGSALISLRIKEPGIGGYNAKRTFGISSSQPADPPFKFPLKIPGGSDIKIRVESVSDTNTQISAQFDMFIIRDQ